MLTKDQKDALAILRHSPITEAKDGLIRGDGTAVGGIHWSTLYSLVRNGLAKHVGDTFTITAAGKACQ